jgi:hypothetical protein
MERRNGGVPVPYTDKELVATVEWLAHLGVVFEEAVNIVTVGQVPHFKHTSLFHRLKDTDIPEKNPEVLTSLLLHLTADKIMPKYYCNDLQKITKHIISVGSDRNRLIQLIDQLAQIGCVGTSDLRQSLGS